MRLEENIQSHHIVIGALIVCDECLSHFNIGDNIYTDDFHYYHEKCYLAKGK